MKEMRQVLARGHIDETDRAIALGYLILAMKDLGLDKEQQDDLYTAFSASVDINRTENAYLAYSDYIIST